MDFEECMQIALHRLDETMDFWATDDYVLASDESKIQTATRSGYMTMLDALIDPEKKSEFSAIELVFGAWNRAQDRAKKRLKL